MSRILNPHRALFSRIALIVLVSCLPALCADTDSTDTVDLSPAKWPAEELAGYRQSNRTRGLTKTLATGSSGMVAATTDILAVRAGLEALAQGGSAVDAVLTTALAQIALDVGSTISYAGILTMVYHDAGTGETHTLDAGYNTVLGEDDPLTIPRARFIDAFKGAPPEPKGRTVLVPGFMAGVEAAHSRFGKVPFEEIFEPAVFFAEDGLPVTQEWLGRFEYRKEVLTRLGETRAVFTREDGSFHSAGDVFNQTALARTLREVAKRGARYMYTGPWGEKLVAAVRADGGALAIEDMAAYEATWSTPLEIAFGGHRILVYHEAHNLAGMMNLIEAAGLGRQKHYSRDAESFFWFSRILRSVLFNAAPDGTLLGVAPEDWLEKETAHRVWSRIKKSGAPAPIPVGEAKPGHSASVVAVDGEGNVAALLHSINTVLWGEGGLFVDGVSIPDSASFQQEAIKAAGPGKRLENHTTPLIVFEDSVPVMALSTIGSGLQQETVKILVNVIGFGMNAREAAGAPSLLYPAYGLDGLSEREQVVEGDYSDELLESVRAMGLGVDEIPAESAARGRGYGAVLTIDRETGRIEGSGPTSFDGGALGR